MTDQSEGHTVSQETTGEMPVDMATDANATETNSEDETFTIESVERKFYPPTKLAEATEMINTIQEAVAEERIRWNFDPEKQTVPDGYGLATVPISERQPGGKGNRTIGVIIAAVPDPETISSHEKGGPFIREVIVDYFLAKIANAARPKATGVPTSLPFSIDDYLERRRGRESLKTFTELAPRYVKALREKGLKMITQPLMRQILQSKIFSQQFNDKLEDRQFWAGLLEKMIEKAKSSDLDPAVLENWRDTRDQVEVVDVSDLDVDELDQMVA